MMLDNEETLFRPGDDRVASLFLWHFVEEVEHRSSALVIYDAVVGKPWYRMRALPAIFKHLLEVMAIIADGVNKHVPGRIARSTRAHCCPHSTFVSRFGRRLSRTRAQPSTPSAFELGSAPREGGGGGTSPAEPDTVPQPGARTTCLTSPTSGSTGGTAEGTSTRWYTASTRSCRNVRTVQRRLFDGIAQSLGDFTCQNAPAFVHLRNPFALSNWTLPVLELMMVAGAVLALLWAIRRLRRDGDPTNLALWFATVIYLFVIEIPLYFPNIFGVEDSTSAWCSRTTRSPCSSCSSDCRSTSSRCIRR